MTSDFDAQLGPTIGVFWLVGDVEGHVPDAVLVEEVCSRCVLGLARVGAVEEFPVFFAAVLDEIFNSQMLILTELPRFDNPWARQLKESLFLTSDIHLLVAFV